MNTPLPEQPLTTAPVGVPEELLTIIPVMKARGCKSRTTIWNEIKDGTFPPPDMVRKRIRYWREGRLLMAETSRMDGSQTQSWTYSPAGK